MKDDQWYSEWVRYQHLCSDEYERLNYQSFLQRAVMLKSHSLLEMAFSHCDRFSAVLELGCGTGMHFKHVKHQFDKYVMSDLNPKLLQHCKEKNSTNESEGVLFDLQDALSLTYENASFDRLISAHLLEHLFPPDEALREWSRVLKPNGVLSVLLPTDPGMLWRLGRRLGPRRNAIKVGIAYDYVMAKEHVNSCDKLLSILRHHFPNSKEYWWPLRIPSVDANLFCVFHAIK
jgi:phosphatidylethanolamine/phosphatidyl-N-methylethanolamine N-methyltransferase